MRRLRAAGAAALIVGAALAVPTVAAASPDVPIAPRIHSARQELAALAQRNDQIIEKYNQADIAYHAKKAAAAHAGAAYRQAQRRVVRAEHMLAQSAAQQYEGGTFSTTGALLSSDSGASYLDKLASLSLISQHNAQVVSSFAAIQAQAKKAQAQADNLYCRPSRRARRSAASAARRGPRSASTRSCSPRSRRSSARCGQPGRALRSAPVRPGR